MVAATRRKMEDQEPGILSLEIAKGPKKGETLDCKNMKPVKIGRVARGNTFSIKEDAISQKHLLIQIIDSQWHVTDLDTSNGTILNDTSLDPNTPHPLSHSDVIKIGAETLIRVHIIKSTKTLEKELPDPAFAPGTTWGKTPGRGKTPGHGRGKGIAPGVEEAPGHGKKKGAGRGRGRKRRLSPVKDDAPPAANKAVLQDPVVNCDDIDQEDVVKGKEDLAKKGDFVEEDKEEGGCLNGDEEGCWNGEEEEVNSLGRGGENCRMAIEAVEGITLGEWFDMMEQWLSKHINNVAEKVIEQIQADADRFDEYLMEGKA